MLVLSKKKKCSVPYCRSHNIKAKGLCSKHYTRERRRKNPVRASFQALKDNAKRRGKEFSLTFKEFEKFAVETSYIYSKGRKIDSLHIDRIDESKGYHIENIQVLTNGDNVRKYHQHKKRLDWFTNERGVPFGFHFENSRVIETGGVPF